MNNLLCCRSFVFTVQLGLASPGLLHDEKIQEQAMETFFIKKKIQMSSNFLARRKIRNIISGLKKSRWHPSLYRPWRNTLNQLRNEVEHLQNSIRCPGIGFQFVYVNDAKHLHPHGVM
jgi:hypothetical protein